MVKQNENEWENYFDSVLFVYRTSKQASAKFSPFFLLYGREPRLPMDLIIGDCKLVIMCGLLNNLVDAGRGKGFDDTKVVGKCDASKDNKNEKNFQKVVYLIENHQTKFKTKKFKA